MGDRALPTVVRLRPVIFVLGELGSGKTTVARRLLPQGFHECDGDCMRTGLNQAARHRVWSDTLLESPGLLLDGVDCLHRRYGAVQLIGELLRARAAAGRRTVLVQGAADMSISLLYPELPCELRASLLLRFPVGGGRRRFVADACRARGLDPLRAPAAYKLDPWSYAGVERVLDGLG